VRQVTLTLPTTLLCRFRTLASEMLRLPTDVADGTTSPFVAAREAHFHEALVYAVSETMRAYRHGDTLEEPPATLVPFVTVYSAVPEAAADFVAQFAARSSLTTAQAWHRVVLEFCEFRGPGVEVELCPARVSGAA
jgi:hypothetical protein